MKKSFLILCMLLVAFISNAQDNKGIQFQELTYKEALAKAKAENKMVFVDCYTSWCGPCKKMATQVFTQELLGTYFNEKFVNIKIDMEKGEGPSLKDGFGISAYPTFLFIENDGEIIHRILGSMSAEEFLKETKAGMAGDNLASFDKKFAAGVRDDAFLVKYFKALQAGGMNKKAAEVAVLYLDGKANTLLDNDDAFGMFMAGIDDPNTESFQFFWKNLDAFNAKYNKMPMYYKWYRVWSSYARTFVHETSYDADKLQAYHKQMLDAGVSKADQIYDQTMMLAYDAAGEWDNFVKLGTKYIKNKAYDKSELDMQLYNWTLRAEQKCTDKKYRAKMAKWLDERSVALAKEEAARNKNMPKGMTPAMSMINYAKAYKDISAKLKQ